MSAASCDKLIRAVCTGDITEIDAATLRRLSSEDVCKLRALTLEGDNIKFQNEGMWGNMLALNLLLSSDDDEKKVSARCGDKLSIFMLALVCCRVDVCRTLLNTFNIPLAVRTEKGLSMLDLAPKALKSDLLKLLDLELQGALAHKPEPTHAILQDLGSASRYASARDLSQSKLSPPTQMSRINTQPDLANHIEKHNRRGSIEGAFADFSSMVQLTRKASMDAFSDFSNRVTSRRATVDARNEAPPPPPPSNRRATVTDRFEEVSFSSGPMTRSQIDALNSYSSLERLQQGLRDLETYVSAERARLAKEQKIKSTEMIAGVLKDTEAGLEAEHAVAEARGVLVPTSRATMNLTKRRSLRPRLI